MSNDKKLLIYSILSFVLFIFIISCNANQTAKKAQNEPLETYQYIVTTIDAEGLHGQSVRDNTKIFIELETINNLQLSENDHISVQFPKDDFETITKVTKLN